MRAGDVIIIILLLLGIISAFKLTIRLSWFILTFLFEVWVSSLIIMSDEEIKRAYKGITI